MAHSVHYAFEWAGVIAGLLLFRHIRRRQQAGSLLGPGSFALIVGSLLGAALGNKLAFWIENPHLWREHAHGMDALLGGQSVVGALLGGWIGVEVAKRITGISRRTGDDFVCPILLGLAIGRIGCFLAGVHDGTHGLPTDMPWGLDLGDGIPRHPTALYEALAAAAALLTAPRWQARLSGTAGLSFRVFLLGYLAWRLMIDFLKPVSFAYVFGWSGLQWICALGAGVLVLGLWLDRRELHRG